MNAPARLAPLDGLRAIAVLSVMVAHYYVTPPVLEGDEVHHFFQRMFSLSFVGVDIFFVLSGFLIGGILLDQRASPNLLPTFYARRFFRIVPAYFLLLLTFVIGRATPGLSTVNYGTYFHSDIPLWTYAAFVQNVAMSLKDRLGAYWLGPAWSLAVEEQFYLLAPFLMQRLTRRQVALGCTALLVGSPLVRLAALFYANNNLAAVFLLPARADGLALGILCALAIREPAVQAWLRGRRVMLNGVITVGLAGLGVMSLQNYQTFSPAVCGFGYTLVNLTSAAVLLHVVLFPDHRLAGLLGTRWLAGIGLISYFVYLFHIPVWYFLHWVFLGRPPLHWTGVAWATTGLSVVVTLALGWLSWRLFEGPLQRVGRRFVYASPAPAPVAVGLADLGRPLR